jgi:hypothetical protein
MNPVPGHGKPAYRPRAVRGGRPPRTESSIVNVLKHHPELRGRPNQLARVLALSDPSFRGMTGGAASKAMQRLRRRFNGSFDPDLLHGDEFHLGRIVTVENSELVCDSCGASLGYGDKSAMYGSKGADGRNKGQQNSFSNELHRVFAVRAIPVPGRGSMISQAAVTIAEFGDDVEGKLTRKALTGLEEQCKSLVREELPQDITTQLARLVEDECVTRARTTDRATIGDAKDAVIAACLSGIKKWPQYRSSLLKLIEGVTIYFPDLTASKRGGSPKADPLDEEERIARAMEREEATEGMAGKRKRDKIDENDETTGSGTTLLEGKQS